MIYELRVYSVVPNRRKALYDRFANGAMALLKKHGFQIVDMWEPTDGQEKFIYLLAWEDANAREKGWHDFRFDPDWQKLKTESEAEGMILARMEHYLLHSAPFFQK